MRKITAMRNLFFVLIFLFATIIVNSQPIFEIRNFYTNIPLTGQEIYVNSNRLILDSLGRFSITSLSDSICLSFNNFGRYDIFFKLSNIKDNGLYILYEFDKFYHIETNMWIEKKSLFGLVKKRYLGPGPAEMGNKSDIFINREKIILFDRNKRYEYSIIKTNRNLLNLQIE